MTTVPPITITGGPASASSRDVLDHGPDLDEDPRGRGRRRTVAVLAGTGLLAVVLGGSELLDRRERAEQARAQEVRDRSAVQLVLPSEWDGTARYDEATDRIGYEVLLEIRNDGPRAVEVLAVGCRACSWAAPSRSARGARGRCPCRASTRAPAATPSRRRRACRSRS
jgi:hypothetical protein